MTQEQKLQIIHAANAYCTEHKISQSELSRKAKINPAYISNMLKGIFTVADTPIADRWFLQLAKEIGVSVTKQYWETIPTRQFLQQLNTLQDAKEHGKTAMVIGDTGLGKTKVTDIFCNKMPQHTYRITVSSLYKLVDIINELTQLVGVDVPTVNTMQAKSLKLRMDAIIKKLIEIKYQGGNPIIIFDEGENMEMSVLKMLKALYDALKDHCAIVIIGTPQLLNKLLNLRKRNRDAIPQLYRRFKAGLVELASLNKHLDFKPFFEKYVSDKGLCNLLLHLCENYGELHDYLEPALREADKRNEPLTEDLFRIIYNMPKK